MLLRRTDGRITAHQFMFPGPGPPGEDESSWLLPGGAWRACCSGSTRSPSPAAAPATLALLSFCPRRSFLPPPSLESSSSLALQPPSRRSWGAEPAPECLSDWCKRLKCLGVPETFVPGNVDSVFPQVQPCQELLGVHFKGPLKCLLETTSLTRQPLAPLLAR